jgi:3-deoxy-manno-octulosonate cytidylyltransferase (CMP-KDO synthetase)
MIVHVLERARESGAAEVLVATDDERIAQAVSAHAGRAVMTSPHHLSGTDRLAEVAAIEGWANDDIIVNLQGDEPLMPGELVAQMAHSLEQHSAAGISTLATPIADAGELFNPNAVKVVLDDQGYALYFSRAPIPWARDAFATGRETLPSGVPYLRHLGLYGYRVGTLRQMARTAPAAIERAESLEQLRALAMGVRIHVAVVAHAPGPGVDTQEDLERANAMLQG